MPLVVIEIGSFSGSDMTSVSLENCVVDVPIYHGRQRSIKNVFIDALKGSGSKHPAFSSATFRVLDIPSLELKQGDKVALLGDNGAGKTSLLKLMASIYFPTTGSAKINGKVASFLNINVGLDQEFTGRENIFLKGAIMGVAKSLVEEKLDEIVSFAELETVIDQPMRTYSTGMQMRLSFAISVAFTFDILLMDEWISVGDQRFQKKAHKKLSFLAKSSDLFVIATHSPFVVAEFCNRAIILSDGKIVKDGLFKDVAEQYFHDNK